MKTKNDMIRKVLALLLTLCLLASFAMGCTVETPAPSKEPSSKEPSTERPAADPPIEGPVVWAENMNVLKFKGLSADMNDDPFDMRFLQFLSAHTEGNYMASPLSFRYALGLLLAGASGETKAELLKALGVSSEEEWTRTCLLFNAFVESYQASLEADIEEFQKMVKEGWIEKDSEEPFRALRVANSVWKRTDIEADFTEDYKKSVSGNYAAEYRVFTPANAVQRINEWASYKTEKMIERLLPDGYPTDDLAVVLMNALYFKDSWCTKFNAAATSEGDFHARDGRKTKKDFMHVQEHFDYYQDADTELVILPMEGGVSMAFVLGSAEGLGKKISKAGSAEVRVTIPKIDLETSFDHGELVEFLRESGVSLAFDSQKADFSAMIDRDIYVDDIIQKTRLKLDEDGVEAAAVTAIMIRDTAYYVEEIKTFTADSPFSFYIYTTTDDTTSILFAGEIVE